MKNTTHTKQHSTALGILRASLPSSPADARAQCTRCGVSLQVFTGALVSLITEGKLSAHDIERVSPLCAHLDLSEHYQALEALVSDESASLDTRTAAYASIYRSEAGEALERSLDATTRAYLCGPWIRSMMRQNDTFTRSCLSTLYTSTPHSARSTLVSTFLKAQEETGAPLSVFSQARKVMSSSHRALIDALSPAL